MNREPSSPSESHEASLDPAPNLANLLNRIGVGAWSVLGVLLVLWAVAWVLVRVQVLIAPIVLSVALIYVLNPLVKRLRSRGIPRVVGSFLGFVLLVGAVVLLGFLVVPSVSDQAQTLADDFPTIYEGSARELEDIAGNLGFEDVELWSYDELQNFVNDPERQDQVLSAVVDRLGAVTSGLFEAILVFFLAPVLAFYVLIDLPRIAEESVALIPERHRAEVVHVSHQLGTAVGGFLRGQVFVAIIVGVLTSFGFWLIGLQFWLIIGMIAGFLNIIPFVGPWVGGGLGVLVGLVTADVTTALSAAVVALAVQQIDNNFVSPTVLRATVRLHPAVVILVLILGGAIGGLWGVLLAVPVAASIKIVVGHWWHTRVLGQSWDAARDALIDESPPEPLLVRIRREADQIGQNGLNEGEPETAGDAAPVDGLEPGGDG